MRKLAVLTFQSLDGVMQAPKLPNEDTTGDFTQGGWADPYWEPVMAQVGKHAMAAPYDVLFGRNTYTMFASSAGADHPMNTWQKYVVTSTLKQLPWQKTKAVAGDIPMAIAQLKQQPGPLLQVHGSWALVQLLLAHQLVDELRLWTFPVVLGAGKRLFSQPSGQSSWTLIKTEPTGNGANMSFYRPII